MAVPSTIGVTTGTGLNLAASSYTEASKTVNDQKVILGEPYLARYSVATPTTGINYGTSSRILSLHAGATLNVRVRRIEVMQIGGGFPTAASYADLTVYRLVAASAGGAALTTEPFDPSDPASGATAATQETTVTLGSRLLKGMMEFVTANPIPLDAHWRWEQQINGKPLIIPAGTGNGLLIMGENGVTGALVECIVEFEETSF